MKRNLIIILVVLIAAITAFIFFTKKDVVFSKETSLYKAVPVSSPTFVELSTLKAIPNDNPILQHLSGINDFGWVLEKVSETNAHIRTVKEIQNKFGKRPVLIAFDFVGKNELRPVIISSLKSSEELGGFEKLLASIEQTDELNLTSTKYDSYKVFHVRNNSDKSLHYSVADGLIIFSPEEILVEKSLRQLSTRNITHIDNFRKVNKTVTAQSDISWYINHRRFPELWANFLNNKTSSSTNEFGETVKRNLRREVLDFQNFASWSELDMSLNDKRISLNGVTAADDSLNHFLSVFEGQQAANCNVERVLPKNTSFFIGFTFSDRDLFFKNLEDYYVHSDRYYWREEHIKTIESRFKKGSRNVLKGLVKNQVVAAITSVSSKPGEHKTLFIINNESRSNNKEQFEGLLQNYALGKKIEFSTLYATYQTSSGNSYRIYQFPYPSLPEIWLGKTFRFAKTGFAVFRNNNLVFADSKETLQKYLNDMDLGASLRNDESYSEFKKASENKSNISAYININRIYALNNIIFSPKLVKGFEKNEEIFRKFDALSWQVICENKVFFNSINIGFNRKPEGNTRAIWEIDLGGKVVGQPQIVMNHRNKSSNEIIVQDENNSLHLIDAGGKEIWSIPVKGKILGKIHQIDYYRNGKLQYLFNTKEKLYLLDRNGNKVANFPLELPSPATNGVNVFDYDNNKKYRYFVACENKKIVAYDHEGKIIQGWKFGQTAGIVTQPVQFFRVNNKDYIVFSDNTKVYVQNRKGERRVDYAIQFSPSKNPLVLDTNGTPKIICSDISGNIYYLYFDGKYARKYSGNLSENHMFKVADIRGNAMPDFVLADGKQLMVFNENGKKLFSEKFDNPLLPHINIGTLNGNDKMIGVTDAKVGRVYLYDVHGKLHQGFPVDGATSFVVGELGASQLSLIVGGDDGTLYNYSIE